MNQSLGIKPIQIFGCGNLLFGDDGFGPAVIEHLVEKYLLPDTVYALDAGTGICTYLFDILLAPVGISEIYIIDAVSMEGRRPGELFELEVDHIPSKKAGDFALHQYPSVSLLGEIHYQTHIDITVLAVQAGYIPDTVQCGLSPEVQKAVEKASAWLYDRIGSGYHTISRNNNMGETYA